MELKNGAKTGMSAARKKRIEVDEELIPTCPRCPDEIILDDMDFGDGLYWFFCPSCDGLFKEVEVSWMYESELEEDRS